MCPKAGIWKYFPIKQGGEQRGVALGCRFVFFLITVIEITILYLQVISTMKPK